MSAITTINGLRELAAEAGSDAGVRVVWATRRGGSGGAGPTGLYERVPNDPLPQRDRLAALANDYALGGSSGGGAEGAEVPGMSLRHLPFAQVSAIRKPGDDADDGGSRLELLFAVGAG